MEIEPIWKEYHSRIEAFLRTKISNQEHINDLSQDIWVRILKSIDSLKSEEKIKSWIFQIANNAIIDYYRKDHSSKELDFDQLTSPDEEVEVSKKLSECILPFINQLPKNEASLLKAIEIEGLSQKDYAEKYGINYSTLKSRVQKSRESLRSVFENCCTFSLDAQGSLMDFQEKSGTCKKC